MERYEKKILAICYGLIVLLIVMSVTLGYVAGSASKVTESMMQYCIGMFSVAEPDRLPAIADYCGMDTEKIGDIKPVDIEIE